MDYFYTETDKDGKIITPVLISPKYVKLTVGNNQLVDLEKYPEYKLKKVGLEVQFYYGNQKVWADEYTSDELLELYDDKYVTLELPKGIYLKKDFSMRIQITDRKFENENIINNPTEARDGENAKVYDPHQVKISRLTLVADVVNRRDYGEALTEIMNVNDEALVANGGFIQIDDIDKSVRIEASGKYYGTDGKYHYSTLKLSAADLRDIECNEVSAAYFPVTYDDGTTTVSDGIYDRNSIYHIFLRAISSIITYPDSMGG